VKPPTEKVWRDFRDTLLFAVGLIGVIHETFFTPGWDRPALLSLYAAMMGLAVVLRNGGKKSGP
jgi:hypothetical protein